MRGSHQAASVGTPKSNGGKSNIMKKSLVLVACMALVSTAFAAADGAAVFKSKCAMCHGADGSASTGMGKSMGLKPLGSPEVQKTSAADMTALVAGGKGKMPGFKGKLSDEEISAVVSYVKTLK